MDLTAHLDRLKESFLWAAAKGGRLQECSSLLRLGADVNWIQRDTVGEGDTPLLAAVRAGHLEVASLLLASGADTGAVARDGDNVLHLCARR